MKNILITGGTGLVGKHLSKLLSSKGYQVRHLSRTRNLMAEFPAYQWNLNSMTADDDAFKEIDFIIHLAGANIAEGRWTKERKKVILESRVKSGELLLKKVLELGIPLTKMISTSATGFYGAVTSDQIFTENDNSGDDFVGVVCRNWEKATLKFKENGFQTVIFRTGIVLTSTKGALEKLITPVKLGVGSSVGNGKQFMPWVHINDLCGMFLSAITDDKITGTYNATHPAHYTNKSFTRTLARVLKRPFWPISIPSFVFKIMFGEMASIILEGSRVSADKIEKTSFEFKFPTLEKALEDLL